MTIDDGIRDVLAGLSRHVGHTPPPDLAGLHGYGDRPVPVSPAGPDDDEIDSTHLVQPELPTAGDEVRHVAVTGPQEDGQ